MSADAAFGLGFLVGVAFVAGFTAPAMWELTEQRDAYKAMFEAVAGRNVNGERHE